MKKLLFLITFLMFSQIASADEYLLKPTGKYKVAFKDLHFIDGERQLDVNYYCPVDNNLEMNNSNNPTA